METKSKAPWIIYAAKVVLAFAIILTGTSSHGGAGKTIYDMYACLVLRHALNAKRIQILHFLACINSGLRLCELGFYGEVYMVRRRSLRLISLALADMM